MKKSIAKKIPGNAFEQVGLTFEEREANLHRLIAWILERYTDYRVIGWVGDRERIAGIGKSCVPSLYEIPEEKFEILRPGVTEERAILIKVLEDFVNDRAVPEDFLHRNVYEYWD